MKLRDQYDWVVLGDHPAALLSASLVARLGLSALVLPFFPSHRFSVSKSGQYFDPESRSLMGLAGGDLQPSATGLLFECLRRIGALPAELQMIHSLGRSPQVITPDARIVLEPEIEKFFEELRRELGGDAANSLGLGAALKEASAEFLEYWLKLPDRLTLDPAKKKPASPPMRFQDLIRQQAAKAGNRDRGLSRWFSNDQKISSLAHSAQPVDLSQVFSGLWYGITSGIHEDPDLPSLLQALALGKTLASYQGGMTAYREFLIRLAKRLGADVPAKAECKSLFVESGRLLGVQISHHANMIGCSAGVLGCSLAQINDRVSISGNAWFRKLKTPPKPVGWRFTLALTVHEEAIPAGLSMHAVWKEQGAPVLELEVVDPSEFGQGQPGHRVIFARAVIPFSEESLTEEYQRMITARIFRQLTEIIPFLEFHVTRIFPDFRADTRGARSISGSGVGLQKQQLEQKTSEFRDAYPFPDIHSIPENLRVYSSAPHQGLGSRSGVEGLFVASGESFPELGSLGGTAAALESVAWIAHRCGLPGPFV